MPPPAKISAMSSGATPLDADLALRVEWLARQFGRMIAIVGDLLTDSLGNEDLSVEDAATRMHMHSTLMTMRDELDQLWPPPKAI
jgi:hypothetical protein